MGGRDPRTLGVRFLKNGLFARLLFSRFHSPIGFRTAEIFHREREREREDHVPRARDGIEDKVSDESRVQLSDEKLAGTILTSLTERKITC